jgi:DNA polymerase-3 subunit delta'
MSKDDVQEVDRLEGVAHPRETRTLVGQEAAERTFLDAYRSGRFPPAWIVAGPEGIGKATFAYRAARFVLAHPDPASEEVRHATDLSVPADHPASRKVAALSHTGLFVLRRQLNEKKTIPTQIPVDLVRKALDFFATTAGEGGWRVCIVDSAEDLNTSGANALLKVVEEPPPRSLFLIVSHLPGRLLPTIRSRCRMLRLRPLSEDKVVEALVTGQPPQPEAMARRAAALAEGSVRAAHAVLDEGMLAVAEAIRDVLRQLPNPDWNTIHAIADGLAGRANERNYDIAMDAIFGWLAAEVEARAGEGVGRLAPLAEVWDKVARSIGEADSYNLDKRALVLTLFTDLSAALRASRAA